MSTEEVIYAEERVEDWVMSKVDEWQNHYDSNYREKHDEYYRLWRGIWADEDKTRQSERSKIISPALQQAVESNVAEIEEATFGRGKWFDIRDDYKDQETQDIAILKKQLTEDFEYTGIRKAVSECLINSAVFGTGVAEINLESILQSVPDTQPVMDGQLQAVGVSTKERIVIKMRPIMPQNFFIDPLATSIDEALGCGVDEFVSKHYIEMLQEQGVFDDVPITRAAEDIDLEPDRELLVYSNNKVRLTKYYGLVPSRLLKDGDKDSEYTEAIVVLANGGSVLKAIASPYMMKDRPMVAFPWDTTPSRFWGRGVCEKGYNSQKALDAELRARIDALALTVHPMMAMDATRIPRGTKPEIRAGKLLLTNGDPKEILNPFHFGNVDQITFAQASALQDMVQQATGAIDSAGLSGVVNGEATAAGISMGLGAIIKRQKRTLINFQDNFLIPFVKKAAWRYMQFEPDLYPAKDYKFCASSTLGIIAREYEVTQLVQLLQTMGQDSPLYPILVQSVIENMNLSNRDELLQVIKQSQQPDPQQQQMQQQQMQMEQQMQQAQMTLLDSQAKENYSQANKYTVEAQNYPTKLEIEKLKAASTNLEQGVDDDVEFGRRLQIAELHLKEKDIDTKREIASMQQQAKQQADMERAQQEQAVMQRVQQDVQ